MACYENIQFFCHTAFTQVFDKEIDLLPYYDGNTFPWNPWFIDI